MNLRPKLRTVLLIVNLTILVLPLGGIAVLRLYETELVQRTESELLSQGTVISLVFRDRLLGVPEHRAMEYGRPLPPLSGASAFDPDHRFNPILPTLDVAKEHLRPPVSEALEPDGPADHEAALVGLRIIPLLKEAQQSTLAGIRIVDFKGTVVASTGAEMGLSLRHREEVRRALKGELVSLLYQRSRPESDGVLGPLSRRTRYRVHVAVPVRFQENILGAVMLMRTPLDVRKALYFHRGHLAAGLLVLAAAVLAITLLTSLTISRPIGNLIKKIEGLSRSGQGVIGRLKRPGTREVDRLSEAFADMSQKLEERAAYIRTFTSNVSHAFKTPLSSTRASAELLKDHLDEMNAAERARFLDIIQEDTERLERLVRRLNDLARADTFHALGESTDLAAVLEEAAQRHRDRGLRVTVHQDDRVRGVGMDRETLESVISNLLDNAARHGGPEVHVRIKTRAGQDESGDMVEISVTDSGRGISEANAARVFRPFFTTAKDRGGTGLGLPIVRSLVEAHGGTIDLLPSSSDAGFLIRLPAAAPRAA